MVKLSDGFNAADLRNICTEAGRPEGGGEQEARVQAGLQAHLGNTQIGFVRWICRELVVNTTAAAAFIC